MVPQVVLGETIAKIFTLFDEKEHVTILENFYHILTKYKIDLEKNLPGITNQICKIMLKLQQLDSNLSNNDALILAHVIADPNSKFFFTNDKTMLINQNVTTYINDLYKDGKRKMKLEIRETL